MHARLPIAVAPAHHETAASEFTPAVIIGGSDRCTPA